MVRTMTVEDRGNRARLLSITVADPPRAWADAGFTVTEATADRPPSVRLGLTDIVLDGTAAAAGNAPGDGPGDGPRIRRWEVAGLDAPPGRGVIDGIATDFAPEPSTEHGPDPRPDTSTTPSDPPVGPSHPNGASGLDHVVVMTPDLERTTDAFARCGLAVRRIRSAGTSERPLRQAFLRLGPTIVEVVGPADRPTSDEADGPARWFGLAVDVDDLDPVADLLGEGLGPVRPAVQAGRRIATVRHRRLGMSVPVALMDRLG